MDIRFSQTHHYLCQEAMLCKSTLLAGFDNLIKANFDDYHKGYFYTAFFNISIGIERLLKIITIIHHMNNNDLKPPSESTLRKLGHNLINLDQHCLAIINAGYQHDAENKELLSFLSDFASGTRYYNINSIVKAPTIDPLDTFKKLVYSISNFELSGTQIERTQNSIFSEADKILAKGGGFYSSRLDHEGQPQTIVDELYLMKIYSKIAPRMVWRIIEILQPHKATLDNQVIQAQRKESSSNKPNIPYLYEFFPFLLTNRSTAIRRKRWTGLF